ESCEQPVEWSYQLPLGATGNHNASSCPWDKFNRPTHDASDCHFCRFANTSSRKHAFHEFDPERCPIQNRLVVEIKGGVMARCAVAIPAIDIGGRPHLRHVA